jgi:hypothetical protein
VRVYVETPADAAFTAFLANLTPGKVLRDLDLMTSVERKRQRFLRQKQDYESGRSGLVEQQTKGQVNE